MPLRNPLLLTNEYYHIYNRGITDIDIFTNEGDYYRFIDTIRYYLQVKPPLRFSHYIRLPFEKKFELAKQNNFAPKKVKLLAYCLMPTHFHMLLKQVTDDGISTFIARSTNSFTKYYNTKRRRHGPIFQGEFKAVQIESQEQLIHVSRYIHLNPYSNGIVKRYADLRDYKYSSFNTYLDPQLPTMCSTSDILGMFPSVKAYIQFISDNSNYQRCLESVKHLTIDSDL